MKKATQLTWIRTLTLNIDHSEPTEWRTIPKGGSTLIEKQEYTRQGNTTNRYEEGTTAHFDKKRCALTARRFLNETQRHSS